MYNGGTSCSGVGVCYLVVGLLVVEPVFGVMTRVPCPFPEEGMSVTGDIYI